jgi:hypothetical protein
MMVYVCFKKFKNSCSYPDEVLGVFSTILQAEEFASGFPLYSMDDPDLFDVKVLPFEINKTRWSK